MQNWRISRVAVVGLAILSGGCFTGTTPVRMTTRQEAVENRYLPKLRLVEGTHEAKDIDQQDPGARAAIRDRLEAAFYKPGNFVKATADGPDVLTTTYRILHFNSGDRGSRFMSAGGSRSGDAGVLIEATFGQPAGVPLAKLEAGASVVMGTFGGNISATYERIARDINTYARNHFLDSRLKK